MLNGHMIGEGRPLFLIAGPCVVESDDIMLRVAELLARQAQRLGIAVVFKSSFDKANRTSGSAFRGPGLDAGLAALERVRAASGLPILTDVHDVGQVAAVAQVVDVLQTPAFLARQTDLICAVAASGRPANIKKAQFMAPGDMQHVVAKAREAATAAGQDPDCVMLCERGSSFGYGNLVVDMRSIPIMAQTGAPIVFDATHSVQLPGSRGNSSGGQREYVGTLAAAAVAAGAHGVFMETHPDPDIALSDGPNALPLAALPALLDRLVAIHAAAAG